MKTSITIKDIARKLGVSPSTVSRALKNHPDISENTKNKVQEMAREFSYRPNPIALNLKHKRSNTIGVIIPEIVHYFFSSIISGIGDYAYSQGFNVITTQSNELYDREVNDLNNLIDNRVDGVLMSIAKTTRNYNHLKRVLDQGIPVVFFDRFVDEIPADKVVVDDEKGGYNMVNHLLEQGAERIGFLGTKQQLSIGKNRLQGYYHAHRDHRLVADEHLIKDCDTYEKALEVASEMLSWENPPDAFFAVNDETAIGTMEIIKRKNLRIPEDIKVAGFTNSLMSKMSDPKLTTVEQNGYLMGQHAAKMLINRLQGNIEDYSPKTITLDAEIIVRGTTVKNV